ncbi:MAG: ABC transporter permease, partial [Candidatus Latescibacteria bacterium]|nr:ABC transporter permease [Candidatus Latescibacterota bacterium]
LLVGDSVRGSLRDLSLDRLGKTDQALVSARFFRADLAQDLLEVLNAKGDSAEVFSAVTLGGSAVHARKGARASRVQIQGIDELFAELFDADISRLGESGPFPAVVVNEALRKELDAQVGDAVLLSFAQPSDIHRESLFGHNELADATQTLRLTLVDVLPDRGMGRFGLRAHQSVPLNAFVSLPVLQKAMGQPNRVNTILVSGKVDSGLDAALSQAATLDDLGIVIWQADSHVSVESTQFVLQPHLADVIQNLADEADLSSLSVLTYLANTIQVNEKDVPYSTVVAMDVKDFGGLTLLDGAVAPALDENEIFLNAWTAKDLGAQVGDTVEIGYFEVGSKEDLITRRAMFRLKGIVAMTGLGGDPTLSPEYPGLQGADDMSAWDAPFPVSLDRIREQDELYWDDYQAAPKAFVSAATGQRLWKSRFGVLTSIRVGVLDRKDSPTIAATLGKNLKTKILPQSVGLVFQPVKERALGASSGATDFGGLFVGFSQFLIVSAALLVGLLFRLGVEQRAKEVGILMATGYDGKAIRKRFMGEALVLAGVGGLLGLAGAVGYAWMMMVGLRTWWVAAVGTSELYLHVNGVSLVLGYVISLVVVLFAIWRTIRRLGRVPVRSLLSGVFGSDVSRTGQRTKGYALGSLILAIGCLVGATGSDATLAVGLSFGCGALLLISGLSFLALWFRRPTSGVLSGLVGMGIRNSVRQPGRSLLCVSLIGCACFVVVAVGANQRVDLTEDVVYDKTSGTGGFSVMAETDVPIYQNLNSEDGRFELGFSEADASVLDAAKVFALRALPGEDVSCLNLYQPQTPNVLGVPNALIERGGFSFAQTLEEVNDPWSLLAQDLGPNVIPTFGDVNSVMWILHKSLGDDIVLQNGAGEDVTLRLVGLLNTSIFQSDVLISEANFLKHFPSQGGYGYFLAETDQPDAFTALLEKQLADVGLDAMSTGQKLAHFRTVENTYLSTFQTLGGLGLLLGTFGLGIVILRNVIERQGELAALRAFGFRRKSLSHMLLIENGFLILMGLAIGTVSALVTAAPHLLGYAVPWQSLGLTLLMILEVGLIVGTVAVYFALRMPLLSALKREGV